MNVRRRLRNLPGINPVVISAKFVPLIVCWRRPWNYWHFFIIKGLFPIRVPIFVPFNDNVWQFFSAVFAVISADSHSAGGAVQWIRPAVTIIGIWREKIKKFRSMGIVLGSAGMIWWKLLKDFRRIVKGFKGYLGSEVQGSEVRGSGNQGIGCRV